MKKTRFSRFIIFAMTVFLLLIALLFFISSTPSLRHQASSIPSTAASQLNRVIRKPYEIVHNLGNQLSDLLNTYQENQVLKQQISRLENQDKLIEELTADNDRLRDSLEIKEKFLTSETLPTRVLVRSSVAWLDSVIIDKGSKDGVNSGMLLVSSKGLVGSIEEINDNSSQVMLLTNTVAKTAIPVKISAGSKTIYGILSGYDPERQAVKINQLNSHEDIPVDSYVATSGLDGETASDIAVGKVLEVEIASDQSRIVYASLAADFSQLTNLSLVGR